MSDITAPEYFVIEVEYSTGTSWALCVDTVNGEREIVEQFNTEVEANEALDVIVNGGSFNDEYGD